MIKAILVDDEPLARSMLREYLEHYPSITVVAECGDGFEGAKAIMQYQPDVIFLDIQMPKINGFELLEIIDAKPAVIFTTAFDDYAIRAFEQHAVDYLLKPISKKRFDDAIHRLLERKKTELASENTQKLLNEVLNEPTLERVVVKTGSTIKIIPVADMVYLEADDDYVRIHTHEGTYLKHKTMASFEKQLDSTQFVRVHRSFIVKISHISRLEVYDKEGYMAILAGGNKLNVSKAGYARLKQLLGM